jgi:hypothetical protein
VRSLLLLDFPTLDSLAPPFSLFISCVSQPFCLSRGFPDVPTSILKSDRSSQVLNFCANNYLGLAGKGFGERERERNRERERERERERSYDERGGGQL